MRGAASESDTEGCALLAWWLTSQGDQDPKPTITPRLSPPYTCSNCTTVDLAATFSQVIAANAVPVVPNNCEDTTKTIVHLVSGLAVGGKEAAALRLANRGIAAGDNHQLLLYDTPYRNAELDFEPGGVPTSYLQRKSGIDLNFAWKLARHLTAKNARIVHAYNDTAIFYAALATQIQTRSPAKLVGTFHTWPSHATVGARILTRWATNCAHAVVAVSEQLRSRLFAARWLDSCQTIWNGVDLVRFFPRARSDHWREELCVSQTATVVGHIGRFDVLKRQFDLIEAARIIQNCGSNVVFILVGQGPTMKEVAASAQGLLNVHFVPHVSDVAGLLGSLDIFTLCSSQEAAPLVLLEAIASGLPIVATEVGGVPDIVGRSADITCAVLVPPCQPIELANAILP